ncbi:MAG: FadR family transcriptional regulator [Actinobacteria bacterium]|nr:FadR family transcriptional regulator [Actinomycetota bacterium]
MTAYAIEKGGGTFVAQPSVHDLSDGLRTMIGMTAGLQKGAIHDLINARTLLEVEAARLAAERCDLAALESLEAMLPPRDTEWMAGEPAIMSNLSFHCGVLRASGNRMLEIIAYPIIAAVHDAVNRRWADEHLVTNGSRAHWRMLDLMRAGDSAGAAALMQMHVDRHHVSEAAYSR